MTALDELKAKHARELAELETSEAIAAALPRKADRIFIYPLSGKSGSVTYGDNYKSQFLTPDELAELVKAMPPVPLLRTRGGCTSFTPEEHFDALPPEKQAKDAHSVAPFLLRVDLACVPQHHHAPKVEVEWITRLAGHLVEISVVINPRSVIQYEFKRQTRSNEFARVDDTLCTLLAPWDAIHHQDHGDNIERLDVIKWGRGSDDSGHNFTFYSGTHDLDIAHHFARVASLIRIGKA